MPDTYANYAALAAVEDEGVDYRIDDRVGITVASQIAIHGGGIEIGTLEAADAAAAQRGHYYYTFEGLVAGSNGHLHITSVNFDEPRAVALQSQVHRTVSWHGTTDETAGVAETWVGGLDTALRDALILRLGQAGFTVTLADPATYPEIAGVNPNNIANRNLSGAGAQLELSSQQRKDFFPGGDWSRSVRESGARTDAFWRYVTAVNAAVEDVTHPLTPGGAVPSATARYTAPRSETWRWNLLTPTDAAVGRLDGVGEGRIEQSVFNAIRGTGSLSWAGRASEQPDWWHARVQPVYTARSRAGTVSWPVGVYLTKVPRVSYSATGISVTVELYDKLLIVDEDGEDQSFTAGVGTVATTLIRQLLAEYAPGSLVSVVDSTETLRTAMTWEAGTSGLRIINDLCAAINYFSMWCDGRGAYRVEPYRDPSYRPIEWEFRDGEENIYLPEFGREQDRFGVPNKVVLISQATIDAPTLVGVATNMNPLDPTSYPGRDNRWVRVVEGNIEASSQAVINALAQRRLVDLSRPSATIDLDHALLPLDPNDAVRFIDSKTGIDTRAVLQSYSVETSPGSLCRANYLEVLS